MKSRVARSPGGQRNRRTLRAYTTGLVKMSLELPLGRMVAVNDYFHEQYGMRSLPLGSEAGWYHDLSSSLIFSGAIFLWARRSIDY